jgi:hypothetical protein
MTRTTLQRILHPHTSDDYWLRCDYALRVAIASYAIAAVAFLAGIIASAL